jgi:hypothetical protein
MLTFALAVALGLVCPRDPSLGAVTYTRGSATHVLALADCRDRVVRARPALGSELPPGARFRSPRSSSLAADGVALAVNARVVVQTMLGYPDYVTRCGSALVVVAGGDRIATRNKRLLVLSPPRRRPRKLWRAPRRAFGSVACAPDGRSVVVLSQPASGDASFFHAHWSLWRVGLDGSRRLVDAPPAGSADESPRFGTHGRLFFVRERRGHGTLRLLGTGPIADLGFSLGYYGHTDWPYRVR